MTVKTNGVIMNRMSDDEHERIKQAQLAFARRVQEAHWLFMEQMKRFEIPGTVPLEREYKIRKGLEMLKANGYTAREVFAMARLL